MMISTNIHEKINDLINKSAGKYIQVALGHEYYFTQTSEYNETDISSFQKIIGYALPKQYSDFLIKVGACKLYFDKYELGIVFYKLEEIISLMDSIFLDRNNPFPKLIIIGANLNNGDSLGIDMTVKNNSNFSLFSPEEDPESWIKDTKKNITLNMFLEKILCSYGEDYYL